MQSPLPVLLGAEENVFILGQSGETINFQSGGLYASLYPSSHTRCFNIFFNERKDLQSQDSQSPWELQGRVLSGQRTKAVHGRKEDGRF